MMGMIILGRQEPKDATKQEQTRHNPSTHSTPFSSDLLGFSMSQAQPHGCPVGHPVHASDTCSMPTTPVHSAVQTGRRVLDLNGGSVSFQVQKRTTRDRLVKALPIGEHNEVRHEVIHLLGPPHMCTLHLHKKDNAGTLTLAYLDSWHNFVSQAILTQANPSFQWWNEVYDKIHEEDFSMQERSIEGHFIKYERKIRT